MADSFKQDRPALEEEIIRARALKRVLRPEDIGRAVVFFASFRAKHIRYVRLNINEKL